MKKMLLFAISLVCVLLAAQFVAAIEGQFMQDANLALLNSERVTLSIVPGSALLAYPGYIAIADLDSQDGRVGTIFTRPTDIVPGENYAIATSPINPYLTIAFTMDGVAEFIDGTAVFPLSYRRSAGAFMAFIDSQGNQRERYLSVNNYNVDSGTALVPNGAISSVNACAYKKPFKSSEPVIYAAKPSSSPAPGAAQNCASTIYIISGLSYMLEHKDDGSWNQIG